MAGAKRADLLLYQRGLAESREKARALILAGRVFSGDARVEKAGTRMAEDAPLEVRGGLPYVGRGGLKLEAALDGFRVDPEGRRCLDVGASTGGFTDCLLQRGAKSVHAVDVGYGQLAWKLRQDPRVTVMERTNFRRLPDDAFPHPFALAVADLSFISLRLILPRLKLFLEEGADVLLLVKPQFEVGKGRVGKGGVVRSQSLRREALEGVLQSAREEGFRVLGSMDCPLPGADGNVEFLAHLRWGSVDREEDPVISSRP